MLEFLFFVGVAVFIAFVTFPLWGALMIMLDSKKDNDFIDDDF